MQQFDFPIQNVKLNISQDPYWKFTRGNSLNYKIGIFKLQKKMFTKINKNIYIYIYNSKL